MLARGTGWVQVSPTTGRVSLIPGRLGAGYAELFDQFAEVDQLGLRIVRRRNLDPYRQTAGALPRGDDERGIPADVIEIANGIA